MLSRTKVIYENCKVLDISGNLLFRTSQKRLDWYLTRNLATRLDSSTIQLTFQNKGTGRRGEDFYLQDMRNECSVCGTPENLTMHHIVPHQYRQHMEEAVKSHSSHDLLPLCIACHDEYEKSAMVLKMHVAACFDAPMDGRGWIERKDIARGRRAAAALLGTHVAGIPAPRVQELREVAGLAVDAYKNLFPSDMQHDPECSLSADPCVHDLGALCALPMRERGPAYVSHGEIVVDALLAAASSDTTKSGASKMCDSCSELADGGVVAFVAAWRCHFLKYAQPKSLPDYWDPSRPVYNGNSEEIG
ncbi:hypothetical protein IW140_001234 [Coemansia sp. RSA 1813]|nr:hypothetical protein IW140_001234 [Coemansia sp. RSA 1813]